MTGNNGRSSTPLRILHVVDTLQMGGLENGVVNLIKHLDSRYFENVVCAIRSIGEFGDRIQRDRVKVICLNKSRPGFSIQVGNLRKVIQEFRPDIIHSRNWGCMEAVVAGKASPGCVTIHSEHGIETRDGVQSSLLRRLYRRTIFELADQVMSVSNELREKYARETGFPSTGIEVIHNGVDTQRFRADRATRDRLRAELGVSLDSYCFGVVGRLEPVKDIGTLLEAVQQASGRLGNWKLLVAGDGSQAAQLKQFSDSTPVLRERVIWLGKVNDIPALLNALDVYILPSLYEGISNSLLEAMATGLPVIATNIGGTPEVLINGESGYLVPVQGVNELAERLMFLRENEAMRLKLGRGAAAHIGAHFSIQSMVKRYEGMYKRVVGSRRGVIIQ